MLQLDVDKDRRAQIRPEFYVMEEKSDVQVVVELARQAHLESRLSYIDFDPRKAALIVEDALQRPKDKAIILSTYDGNPVGFCFCGIGQYHIGTGHLLATIHNINVVVDVRRRLFGGRVALGLFAGAKSWAKARNASEISLHVTSGVQLARTHKLAKRLGFTFVGGSYAKTLN